jgi:hypothetical protein
MCTSMDKQKHDMGGRWAETPSSGADVHRKDDGKGTTAGEGGGCVLLGPGPHQSEAGNAGTGPQQMVHAPSTDVHKQVRSYHLG